MESLSGPEVVREPNSVDWNIWGAINSLYDAREVRKKQHPTVATQRFFRGLVQQYTKRSLRFDSDALNAFTGIPRHLQRSDPPIYTFAGLPHIPWADLVARRKLISHALAFNVSAKDAVVERRPAFPSWT